MVVPRSKRKPTDMILLSSIYNPSLPFPFNPSPQYHPIIRASHRLRRLLSFDEPDDHPPVPNLELHSAAASGNVGLVHYALTHGQPVNSVLHGVLPLHAACSGGNVSVVRMLIERGADVNAPRLPRRYSDGRKANVPSVGTAGERCSTSRPSPARRLSQVPLHCTSPLPMATLPSCRSSSHAVQRPTSPTRTV